MASTAYPPQRNVNQRGHIKVREEVIMYCNDVYVSF